MAEQFLRTRSVTTKVTEVECKQLEKMASECGMNLSEWVRGELLGAERSGSEAKVLLGEMLALRTILINLLFSLAQGKAMTAEAMQQLIARADGDKTKRAMAQLAGGNEAAPEGV